MDKHKMQHRTRWIVSMASGVAQLSSGKLAANASVGIRRFLVCALLARGMTPGGYLPFGLAMASALMARGASLSAIGGLFAGMALRPLGDQGGLYVAAALLVLCVTAICSNWRTLLHSKWFCPAVATCAAVVCTMPLLPLAQLQPRVLLSYALAHGLTFVSCRLYCTALSPPVEQGGGRRAVILLAVCATGLMALADVSIASIVTPARVMALMIALATSYLAGVTTGTAVGVGFGVAMDLAHGGGALFTCTYGLTALTAGLFRTQGRVRFTITALGGGLCAALLSADSPLFVPVVCEVFVSVILVGILPTSMWNTLRQTIFPDGVDEERVQRRVRVAAGQCASEAAQAFYELYTAMLTGLQEGRARGEQNVKLVFDRASERVCKRCVLCSQCWQRDYVTTLAALDDVTRPMLKRGRAVLSDFPQHFASRCIHLPELIHAINAALFTLREQQSLRRQKLENTNLLARQYAGISDLLGRLGREVGQSERAQPMLEKKVKRYTAAFGWVDEVCVVRDTAGRLVIELYGKGLDEVEQQGAGFAAGLSALLGVGLTIPKRIGEGEEERLVLRERAPFRAVVGIGRRQKEGTVVSGDTSKYFVTEQGVACLLLSDGMGTGAAAAQDSRMLVSTMERFLLAGVSLRDALHAISPAVRLRADGKRFTTLDAVSLDLFTGCAQSLKCGAAPSYLYTGGKWSQLGCTTLPVGLAEEEALGEPVPLRLGHGDLLVMLSDGVSDGLQDDWLYHLLHEHADDSPRDLAARLVSAPYGREQDDRSAMVLRVERTTG